MQYSNSQYDAAHTAEILEKRAKEYEIKLIENGDAQKYMKLLNPMSVAVTKRETGNALIEITVDSADFCIFDNIPAVIDGCLEAIVKNGSGTTVGKAYITLPIYGVLRKTNLRGVANLHKGANTDSLSITFKPYHLWAMEKQNLTKFNISPLKERKFFLEPCAGDRLKKFFQMFFTYTDQCT